MNQSVFKMTFRTIKTFFGRYLALLLIVALSVGFFGGLKITEDAMYRTCEDYLAAQNFYDFRLISTLGFDDSDVERLEEISAVEIAEGNKSTELIADFCGDSDAYSFISLPESTNLPSVTAGRMPQTSGECLADAAYFDESSIGQVITITDDNDADSKERLSTEEFTIVGLANSPVYLSADRTAASIGNGSIAGFIYIPEEDFLLETYTEIDICLKTSAEIYSDAYSELIEENESEITTVCRSMTEEKYQDLLTQLQLTPDLAQEAGISAPESYVLTRDDNSGYISFENDASIISGIANIFPLIFILIAILVCITTMTRMVDEERTQIGTLKALGFSNAAIQTKYLLYAGSATVIGWIVGFFLGTWGLPKIFWYAYNSIYDFAPLKYLFRLPLALVTLIVSIAGILISTWFSCRKELKTVPALLIRPSAPKSGKKILLERISPLWKRLSFLQKVVLRNMLRYKRRLVMMLIGIGCCTALMLTAFGVRDSMIDIGTLQYEEIQKYDTEVVVDNEKINAVKSQIDQLSVKYTTAHSERVDVSSDETVRSINLICFEENDSGGSWYFSDGEHELAMPATNEAILGTKVAENLGVEIGDVIEIRNSQLQTLQITVCGIFENYVDHYIVISPDTIRNEWGSCEYNTLFLHGNVSTDAIMDMDGVISVSQTQSAKEQLNSTLLCLNYIICLIVLFSGALAFIVIYNLTNINIAERIREIATVQVLGFYPKETNRYVLHENVILSAIAGVIGLFLGVLFHYIVMKTISIDAIMFQMKISPWSFLLAFVLTLIFAVIVNLAMKRRIQKIHMAESLKSTE